MIHDTTVTNNRAGQRKPRPSLAREARDLYQLAAALGDSETMAIATKDMEIAFELERADELLEPLPEGKHGIPGCRYSAEEKRHIGVRPVTAMLHVTPRVRTEKPKPEPKTELRDALARLAPGTISTIEYARRRGISRVWAFYLVRSGALPAKRITINGKAYWRIPDKEAD